MRIFFFILIFFLIACEESSSSESTCSDDIVGVWDVTNIQPVGCTLLTYEFGQASADNILSVILNDGSRMLTGSGLLDATCSSLTYTVSQGSTIINGAIDFENNTLTDRSDLGCLISAEK